MGAEFVGGAEEEQADEGPAKKPRREVMSFKIRLPSGDLLTVEDVVNIRDLRSRVSASEGVPAERVELVNNGQVIDDYMFLDDLIGDEIAAMVSSPGPSWY